eukprot:14719821-Ditylum_brightwellii.AAC.1
MVIRNIHFLLTEKSSDSLVRCIMNEFSKIQWWFGVRLVIDMFPKAARYLDDVTFTAIPTAFSVIGDKCSLLTLWDIIRNKGDL